MRILKKASHKIILAGAVGVILGWYFKPQIDLLLGGLAPSTALGQRWYKG